MNTHVCSHIRTHILLPSSFIITLASYLVFCFQGIFLFFFFVSFQVFVRFEFSERDRDIDEGENIRRHGLVSFVSQYHRTRVWERVCASSCTRNTTNTMMVAVSLRHCPFQQRSLLPNSPLSEQRAPLKTVLRIFVCSFPLSRIYIRAGRAATLQFLVVSRVRDSCSSSFKATSGQLFFFLLLLKKLPVSGVTLPEYTLFLC